MLTNQKQREALLYVIDNDLPIWNGHKEIAINLMDDIAALESELAWQPIETAPNDNLKPIDLYTRAYGRLCDAQFRNGKWCEWTINGADQMGWVEIKVPITHWIYVNLPLPDAPDVG